MSQRQSDSSDLGGVILVWWRTELADRQSGRARALAARLRRAGPVEALAQREVHDLGRALGMTGAPGEAGQLSLLVRVLAHFREYDSASLPRRLGQGDPPAMSNARFQRLIRARSEDLPALLIRAAPMVGRACNIAALGRDLLHWGDRTRTRWSFYYFGAPVPQSLEETQE